jgi:hypothetical protein
LIGRIIKTGAVLDSDRVLLDLNVGGDAADNFKLYAFITQAQIGVSRGELTTVPFQFTMDGDFLEVIS